MPGSWPAFHEVPDLLEVPEKYRSNGALAV